MPPQRRRLLHRPTAPPAALAAIDSGAVAKKERPGEAPPAPVPARPPQPTAPIDTVQINLQQIVSQLTGYPVEMLGLDMDIEADLGIDSIKRVEILSALEERMPHLPKVTPDMVGTLKTLGQICDYLRPAAHRMRPPAQPVGHVARYRALSGVRRCSRECRQYR
jgi:acyl carrier protein